MREWRKAVNKRRLEEPTRRERTRTREPEQAEVLEVNVLRSLQGVGASRSQEFDKHISSRSIRRKVDGAGLVWTTELEECCRDQSISVGAMALIHLTETRVVLHRGHVIVVRLSSHVVKERGLFQLNGLMADKYKSFLARCCESCSWSFGLELSKDKRLVGFRQLQANVDIGGPP